MSLAQWILNLSLLVWVLLRNLGERPVTRSTFGVPLLVVGVAAVVFLRALPTQGHDVGLELAGAGAGLVLGLVAAALTRTSSVDGRLVVRAGAGFAAVWVAVIGARILFAQWATGAGAETVGRFSMQHQITGADAWTAAFVLLSLAMVLARLLAGGWAALALRRAARPQPGASLVAAERS